MEKLEIGVCPRCGQPQLGIYYSDKSDDRVGAYCENCSLKGYYSGEQLVSIA